MHDRRSRKDRRVNKDRRKNKFIPHSGIENKRVKQQRNFSRREMGSDDNKGRRSEIDQRHFSYTGIIPERRSGKERRSSVYKLTD